MRRHTLTLAAALSVVISSAALAQPASLSYPRAGVVCDSVGKTCYDSYGPSIGITSEVYGQGLQARHIAISSALPTALFEGSVFQLLFSLEKCTAQ